MAKKSFQLTDEEAQLIVDAMVEWERCKSEFELPLGGCVLCDTYRPRSNNYTCEKCPVCRYTGEEDCFCTPFWSQGEDSFEEWKEAILKYGAKLLDDGGYEITEK